MTHGVRVGPMKNQESPPHPAVNSLPLPSRWYQQRLNVETELPLIPPLTKSLFSLRCQQRLNENLDFTYTSRGVFSPSSAWQTLRPSSVANFFNLLGPSQSLCPSLEHVRHGACVHAPAMPGGPEDRPQVLCAILGSLHFPQGLPLQRREK